MKKKSLFRRLLPWIITLLILGALYLFVIVPLYFTKHHEEIRSAEILLYEDGAGTLTMENDNLLFEMDKATSYFTVTDKASGQKWYSVPEDRDQDKIALSTQKELVYSTLSVTSETDSGPNVYNNSKYSIEGQNFSYDQAEDGSISVRYAIGKIERKYMIPQVLTKDHYDEIFKRMSKKTQNKVKENYTKYEPDKLASKSNRDELIAMYPSITEQTLYVLKSSVTSNAKAMLEGCFAEAGYSQEEYDTDQALIAGESGGKSSGGLFNVTVIYRLEGNDLVVEVPYDEIMYSSKYPITSLSVLPMFGAAGMKTDGYIMIPEGGGALINYNNGRTSMNPYYANVYGWDYAEERDKAVSETENAFPVFGMADNGRSFICMLEGASSYAGINADISGRYNSYNYVYASYNVLHWAKYTLSRTATPVVVYEKEIPSDTIVQRYRFLESDSYTDMALAYRERLKEIYPEMQEGSASEDTPVLVEILGAIDKTEVKAGVPVDCVVAATTYDQASDMLTDLKNSGIVNLVARMSGWCNGGVRQHVLRKVSVLNELGGEKGLRRLIATAEGAGIPLYFDGINCFAYASGLLDGFNEASHSARFVTKDLTRLADYSIVTYDRNFRGGNKYYLVKPSYAKENASNLIRKLKDLGAYGVAFRDIGDLISGDLNPNDQVTREQAKAMNVETLREAKANGQSVLIKKGNDYAVAYADLIADMYLIGNAYTIIDETVPFYQIALHGIRDYTGEVLNLNGDWQAELLRCAEYGAGLNFTFMQAEGSLVRETDYTNYYGCNYADLRDKVLETAIRYQSAMKGLNRLRIVGHEYESEDVKVTTYEDGTKVYVNYGEADYDCDGICVKACDYAVKGGNAQ